jgi:hypothetical protein
MSGAPFHFLFFADQTNCNASNGFLFAERNRVNVKINAACKVKTPFDGSIDCGF